MDFLDDMAHLYPKILYVRVGKQYTQVNTKTAYYFAEIRKKLMKTW